ncbi:hypothetical protein DFJ74DRAFT_284646 [Hyaloraphidium curvatum]|nr:hypothetical protein DFJ74DRAFT_284646 [Hyaloraphidium curvatum]
MLVWSVRPPRNAGFGGSSANVLPQPPSSRCSHQDMLQRARPSWTLNPARAMTRVLTSRSRRFWTAFLRANRTRIHLVNAAFQKLADRFHDAVDNRLRWAVLSAVRASQQYIPHDQRELSEILLRIVVVLSSNDSVARTIGLILLGYFAKRAAENADIQFNVRLHLDGGKGLEKEAAVFACRILCQQSQKFATNVIWDLVAGAQDEALTQALRAKYIVALGSCTHSLPMAKRARTACLEVWKAHSGTPLGTAALMAATVASSKHSVLSIAQISYLVNEVETPNRAAEDELPLARCLHRLAKVRTIDFRLSDVEAIWNRLTGIDAGEAQLQRAYLEVIAVLFRFSILDLSSNLGRFVDWLVVQSGQGRANAPHALAALDSCAWRYPQDGPSLAGVLDVMLVDARSCGEDVESWHLFSDRCAALCRLQPHVRREVSSFLFSPALLSLVPGRAVSFVLRTAIRAVAPDDAALRVDRLQALVMLLNTPSTEAEWRGSALYAGLCCLLELAGPLPLTSATAASLETVLTHVSLRTLGAWNSYRLCLRLMCGGHFRAAKRILEQVMLLVASESSLRWLEALVDLCEAESTLDLVSNTERGSLSSVDRAVSHLRTALLKCQPLPVSRTPPPLGAWIRFRHRHLSLLHRALLSRENRSGSPSSLSLQLLRRQADGVKGALQHLLTVNYSMKWRDARPLMDLVRSLPDGALRDDIRAIAPLPVPRFVLHPDKEALAIEVSTSPAWSSLKTLPADVLGRIAVSVDVSAQRYRTDGVELLLSFAAHPDWDAAYAVPITTTIRSEGMVYGRWEGSADLRCRTLKIGLRNRRTWVVHAPEAIRVT